MYLFIHTRIHSFTWQGRTEDLPGPRPASVMGREQQTRETDGHSPEIIELNRLEGETRQNKIKKIFYLTKLTN